MQMEMKNKFINHARNIWDRAVTLMPRVDVFWYMPVCACVCESERGGHGWD